MSWSKSCAVVQSAAYTLEGKYRVSDCSLETIRQFVRRSAVQEFNVKSADHKSLLFSRDIPERVQLHCSIVALLTCDFEVSTTEFNSGQENDERICCSLTQRL